MSVLDQHDPYTDEDGAYDPRLAPFIILGLSVILATLVGLAMVWMPA